MSSNISWQAQTNLSQVLPKELTDSLESLDGAVQTARDILKWIHDLAEFIRQYIEDPADFIAAFLKTYTDDIISMIQDALGLGGGMIVIHPWNRINKRYASLSNHELYPLHVPVMNAQEAFNEFYASFNNVNDPYRPQWTDNANVTGLGFLVIARDPLVFLNIINAFTQILNFKDFNDIIDKFSKDVTGWKTNTEKQIGAAAANLVSFDIEGISNLSFRKIIGIKDNNQVTLQSPIIFDSSLPSLHWYGLSVTNFTFFSKITKMFDVIIDSLVSIIKLGTNPITAFLEVLVKKIEAIVDLIDLVLSTVQSFLISLESTGLYYFEVKEGTGGVNYIVNEIKNSLNNPTTADAIAVKSHLTDSNFSMLFFMGASTGVNLSAWEAMFKNAFDATTEAAQQLAQINTINYAVIPDFKDSVFYYNENIQLRVVSQDATPDHPIYYTYRVTNPQGQYISSYMTKIIGGDNLKVNDNPISFKIVKPSTAPAGSENYSIEINVFDFIAVNLTYTASFAVTDLVSNITTTVGDNTSVTADAASDGTLQITNAGGITYEQTSVSGGNQVTLGSTVPPFDDGSTVTFTGTEGEGFTTRIINNKGYRIANITGLPIPNSFRFLSYPGKICFNFEGALKIKNNTYDTWEYITLPACITITGIGSYTYYIYTPETGWGGPFTLTIVDQAIDGTQIC